MMKDRTTIAICGTQFTQAKGYTYNVVLEMALFI